MSSDDIAISVHNLTKTYRIFGHPGDRIKQFLSFGIRQYHHEFTALKDVTFEIKKGDTVGIIGRNGSGKSTLLQVICGILKPTEGALRVNGCISALLELGAGFNPEFTGRENVYFNGALMGMGKDEMDARFHDIVTFADIGEFIDQPVRMYSSGMYLRLAFAVYVNLDPDVLVVDEALGVGDAGFQSRCFRKINDISDSGKTIIFVSHNLDQIVEFCDRAILLDEGELLTLGSPKYVVGQFQRLLNCSQNKRSEIRDQLRGACESKKESDHVLVANELVDERLAIEVGDDTVLEEIYDSDLKPANTIKFESQVATIESPMILTESGRRVNNIYTGRTYFYTYRVRFQKDAKNVRFWMLIKTTSGIELGGATSAKNLSDSVSFISGGSIVDINFHFDCMLNTGTYFFNAGVMGDVCGSDIFLHRILDAEIFMVREKPGSCATAIVDFGCSVDIKFIHHLN